MIENLCYDISCKAKFFKKRIKVYHFSSRFDFPLVEKKILLLEEKKVPT